MEPRTAEEKRWWEEGVNAEAEARKIHNPKLAELAELAQILDQQGQDDPMGFIRAIFFPPEPKRRWWGRRE